MTADDLTAPLGQRPSRRRPGFRVPVPYVLLGALAVFFGTFVLWAALGDDPFGGEPIAVVPAHLQAALSASPSNHEAAGESRGPGRYDGPEQTVRPSAAGTAGQKPAAPADGTTTVNIINGLTGARQEVTIPAPGGGSATPAGAAIDQKFVEMTPHGAVPKIAADGVRPADAFAQPVKPLPGKPDAPRIALIVGGLGVSDKVTNEAIAKLPGTVTLAFIPYGNDAALVARARAGGHEILLQVPATSNIM